MKITHRTTVVLTAALALIPVAAHADMVWPALFLEPRLVSVPIIALGYLVEAVEPPSRMPDPERIWP